MLNRSKLFGQVVASAALILASGVAAAQSGSVSPFEVSVLGGLQVLN